MSLFQRHRWFAAAAGDHSGLCRGVAARAQERGSDRVRRSRGPGADAGRRRNHAGQRSWQTGPGAQFLGVDDARVLAVGCNQAAWAYHEMVLHRQIPDPYFFDIILFFHAGADDRGGGLASGSDEKRRQSSSQHCVNFLMLLGWWIFLYAFIVFPHQYVVLNVDFLQRLLQTGFICWRTSCCWRS